MDAIIANTAKNCSFDAAHYTWLYVDMDVVRKHTTQQLKERLLAHGNYAAPLHTENVLQPFDNMAVVLRMGKIKGEEVFFPITVHASKGRMIEAVVRTTRKPPYDVLFTLHFKPARDNPALLEMAKTAPIVEYSPEKPLEQQALIRFATHVPEGHRKSFVDYFIPSLRQALCYIAAASDGLLAGESIVYHKPRSTANNAKRVRKGKAPMYEWVTVALERKPTELPAAPKGGTHASPRLHQRRGHWVTSKLGKKFWRNQTVVGKPENGMVFHDYTVKKGERSE
jgi:hypothetical protein